ncbi:hypothetical protein [Flavobacterium sp. 3HN19-14]|uniref:hypothetical protein n=1 Tax=Flavobacterium sp. 3HN19-14 TaxID=3448133 RepID=UPI003EE3B824
MKKILFFLLLSVTFSGISQSVNDYKYVIIPVKYDFQKQQNQYKLSTLTKSYLTKLGFESFYETTIPAELSGDKCDKLFIDVLKVNSTFKVKVQIVFKDCWGKVIYTSEVGKGIDKEFEKGYPQALEDAFKSVAALNYKYNGNTQFSGQKPKPEAPQPNTNPVKITEVSQPIAVTSTVNPDLLFAQPTANGFQLVDNTPKVVLRLTKTSQADYYMATGDNKQGVVYKKNSEWIFDYYKDDKLISEKLNIKF